jgi:hypothetical protein
MQTKRVVLTILAFFVLGFGALAFLGARGRLPPGLARAYGTVASLASSASSAASEAFSALPAPSGSSDEGVVTVSLTDAAAASARRTTQASPLSSARLGAPLVNGKFVSDCGAPDDMKVVVKVTVKMGRPVDVTVKTDPANGAVASCVEKATREMQWDVSPKTQHATVTY